MFALCTRTSTPYDETALALHIGLCFVFSTDAVNVDMKTSVCCVCGVGMILNMTYNRTGKGLLAQEALGLAVELLDELAGKQSRVEDLHPSPNTILLQAQFQDVHLLLCPPRGGGKVPPGCV